MLRDEGLNYFPSRAKGKKKRTNGKGSNHMKDWANKSGDRSLTIEKGELESVIHSETQPDQKKGRNSVRKKRIESGTPVLSRTIDR